MSNSGSTTSSVRSRAEALWSKAKETAHKERNEAVEADRAKTARLRELRMAKEAADKLKAATEAAQVSTLKATVKKKTAAAPKR